MNETMVFRHLDIRQLRMVIPEKSGCKRVESYNCPNLLPNGFQATAQGGETQAESSGL